MRQNVSWQDMVAASVGETIRAEGLFSYGVPMAGSLETVSVVL
jgi:hypothetical protein